MWADVSNLVFTEVDIPGWIRCDIQLKFATGEKAKKPCSHKLMSRFVSIENSDNESLMC